MASLSEEVWGFSPIPSFVMGWCSCFSPGSTPCCTVPAWSASKVSTVIIICGTWRFLEPSCNSCRSLSASLQPPQSLYSSSRYPTRSPYTAQEFHTAPQKLHTTRLGTWLILLRRIGSTNFSGLANWLTTWLVNCLGWMIGCACQYESRGGKTSRLRFMSLGLQLMKGTGTWGIWAYFIGWSAGLNF